MKKDINTFCHCTHKLNNQHQISELFKQIETIFGKEVAADLKQVRFFHEGFHNITYIGKLKDTWVQIRIPKNLVELDYKNEEQIVFMFKDYLYAKNGFIIKKWFPGQDLFKVNITQDIALSIFNCIRNFQKMNAKIDRFNWLTYDIKDQKYHDILNKYKDDKMVLSHNNIKRHNVLVNKYGFIKLIDFEFTAYNYEYVDPVYLHLFLGIEKEDIIKFFNLDSEKFDDFVYLIQTFNKAAYNHTYSKIKTPDNKISDSLLEFENRDYSIINRFIVQKYRNPFDNRLDLKTIENFYFVPCLVYEDNDRVIWRWLNCETTMCLNNRQIKAIARALRTLHDSDVEFPDYIFDKRIESYLSQIDINDLKNDFNDDKMLETIMQWVKEVKPDANCHNDLNLNNIFFTDTLNLYIINWAKACYNNRFLDIAYLFEHINSNRYLENSFWRAYEMAEPKNFYKYRILIHFNSYLYNKSSNGDYTQAGINIKKIKEIFVLNRGKYE
ncbi:Choline/ethanolamine kinase [Metamycoplasma cloacale]|uniref:Aminoglycoside phosphotransferase domain-containing protein n=1 Tax=Metamycoplasma cloacale TaxID=92401 RepID=A0A2Z4LM99_9BACT|nr:phosphotransferase [Metamycoplasma cloacale]AWX42895.1 hypothetical protein DK849_02390 [Metamycoplasma cloacale]VEU79281.1 Choline/ethanolamine kinase [Metamycoplasma cloacale]